MGWPVARIEAEHAAEWDYTTGPSWITGTEMRITVMNSTFASSVRSFPNSTYSFTIPNGWCNHIYNIFGVDLGPLPQYTGRPIILYKENTIQIYGVH